MYGAFVFFQMFELLFRDEFSFRKNLVVSIDKFWEDSDVLFWARRTTRYRILTHINLRTWMISIKCYLRWHTTLFIILLGLLTNLVFYWILSHNILNLRKLTLIASFVTHLCTRLLMNGGKWSRNQESDIIGLNELLWMMQDRAPLVVQIWRIKYLAPWLLNGTLLWQEPILSTLITMQAQLWLGLCKSFQWSQVNNLSLISDDSVDVCRITDEKVIILSGLLVLLAFISHRCLLDIKCCRLKYLTSVQIDAFT